MMMDEGNEATVVCTGYGDLEIGGTVVKVVRFRDHYLDKYGYPDYHLPSPTVELAEVLVVRPSKAGATEGWAQGTRHLYPVSQLHTSRYSDFLLTLPDD